MGFELIAALAAIAGQQVAAQAAQMDKARALRLVQQSVDEFGNINIPKLKELVLSTLPPSELAKIKDDPQYRAQQLAADANLNDVINSGGLTISDRATLNQILQRTSRSESAGRHAIENQQAARGTLDSGNQLAMQLQNQQQSAQGAAMAGEQTAGMAQDRLYRAIQERAQLAGQGLDRDYRQQSDLARAQDAINRGNIDIQNTAAKYNAGLPQQNFQNQLASAGSKVMPNNMAAGLYAGNAADTIGNANSAGKLGMAAAGMAQNTYDNWLKSQNQGSSPDEWGNPYSPTGYGNTNQGMSGASTKGVLLGYDENGKPIYGARKA